VNTTVIYVRSAVFMDKMFSYVVEYYTDLEQQIKDLKKFSECGIYG